MPSTWDTIYALSSGTPPAGVAIVRVSGSRCDEVLDRMAGGVPKVRSAARRTIRDRNNEIIDEGLVLRFKAPASFTGEDCAEFHVHGGRAVVSKLLKELGYIGLRPAEAGEFTRRAFENGRMDLTEVEGLADLIAAETEMQRRMAMEQVRGGLGRLYQDWMQRLTRARALIEAELDFPEEEDIPGSVSDRVWSDMRVLADEIRSHLDTAKAGEIVRDGFVVVLAGRPNAGKSSLMNHLVRRDVAIVTDIPGTTRDVLQVDLDIGGYLVRLSDTAGLRDSQDRVEQEGVRRARLSIEEADLVLNLRDVTDTQHWESLPSGVAELRIQTKCDIGVPTMGTEVIAISVKDGRGIDSLTKRILSFIELSTGKSETGLVTRSRQRDHLQRAETEIRNAIDLDTRPLEVRSEDLRQASHELARLVGRVGVEEMLDVIFSEFCIGK